MRQFLIAILYKIVQGFRHIYAERKIKEEIIDLDIMLSKNIIIYISVRASEDRYMNLSTSNKTPYLGDLDNVACYYEVNLLDYLKDKNSGIKKFNNSDGRLFQDADFDMIRAENEPIDGKNSAISVGYYIRAEISKYAQKTRATLQIKVPNEIKKRIGLVGVISRKRFELVNCAKVQFNPFKGLVIRD